MADPFKKDIKVRFGDTKEVFFRVRDLEWDDAQEKFVPGAYRDLTGVTVTAQIRETLDSNNPLVSFTATLGTQSDLSLGRGSVSLRLTPAQTAAIPRETSTGKWDCEFEYPSGDTFTYIEGDVTFTKDVTR